MAATATIQAAVFDFDSTLSCATFVARLNHFAVADKVALFKQMNQTEIIQNFGGTKRLHALQTLMRALKDNNVKLFIISIGFKQAIQPHLDAVGLSAHFDDDCIFGQDSPELKMVGFVKARLIDAIMRSNEWSFSDVLFVDDSIDHIDRARTVCRTLHVMERGGMRVDREMRAILEVAGIKLYF